MRTTMTTATKGVMASPVYTVRLPIALAEALDSVAEQVGGRGQLIEWMLTEQELPSRRWFREYKFRGISCPVKVSFRLSESAARALRQAVGRVSLSEDVRLLLLYTFTEGKLRSLATRPPAAPPPIRAAQPPPAPHRQSPVSPSMFAVRPTTQPLSTSCAAGAQSAPAAGPFDHLPALCPGGRYVCAVETCEFGRGDGVVALCRKHSGSR